MFSSRIGWVGSNVVKGTNRESACLPHYRHQHRWLNRALVALGAFQEGS